MDSGALFRRVRGAYTPPLMSAAAIHGTSCFTGPAMGAGWIAESDGLPPRRPRLLDSAREAPRVRERYTVDHATGGAAR
jgi:hypothetical protein